MTDHTLKIKSIGHVTHNVLQIVTDKPGGIQFASGQAAKISINKNNWSNKKRPFTFTSLPTDDYLEFTIKTYPDHHGVTNELRHLKPQDELVLHKVFGTINYNGQGVFIAGGAGVTPFISIFRNLNSKNKIGNNMLIFANKTKADIILEDEFSEMLGNKFINILSEEQVEGYHYGFITKGFLKNTITHFNQHFYICGPPPMITDIESQLISLGVDKNLITKEEF